MTKKIITFELPEELLRDLDNACSSGASRSSILRKAVEDYLSGKDELKNLFQRLLQKLDAMEGGNV